MSSKINASDARTSRQQPEYARWKADHANHYPMRRFMMRKILGYLRDKHPQRGDSAQRLTRIAKNLEYRIYLKANSRVEYLNDATLRRRLRTVVTNIYEEAGVPLPVHHGGSGNFPTTIPDDDDEEDHNLSRAAQVEGSKEKTSIPRSPAKLPHKSISTTREGKGFLFVDVNDKTSEGCSLLMTEIIPAKADYFALQTTDFMKSQIARNVLTLCRVQFKMRFIDDDSEELRHCDAAAQIRSLLASCSTAKHN